MCVYSLVDIHVVDSRQTNVHVDYIGKGSDYVYIEPTFEIYGHQVMLAF